MPGAPSRLREFLRKGWRTRAAAVVVAILPLSLGLLVASPAAPASASSGGTVTYTATVNIPAPPSSNFSGASSGDGWAVALTSTAVYNVFHHQEYLGVDCHLQTNAAQTAPCWGGSVTITDSDGSAFYTEGQPTVWINQSNGDLFVFAEHPEDDTVGVVCINTNATLPASNIFCGYQPLVPAGQGPPTADGISGVSDAVQVGTNMYAFNYVNTSSPTGAEDQLLCFSTTTDSACPSQPYAVSTGLSGISVSPEPTPPIATFGGQIEIPVADGGTTTLGCYEPSVAGGSCGGSWPVATGLDYEGSYGAAFPMLNSAGTATGFCIPDGSNPCWTLAGASTATPSGMTGSTMPVNSSWNGPATTVGPRVYVPNGDYNAVYCFDYSADAECSNFPKDFSNLGLLYSVNVDPQRPTCFWVNSDNGSSQIQNFDAFTAGACGQGPIRLQAANFVAPPAQCVPTQWTGLQITDPSPPTVYGGGSVEFENADGSELSGTGGSNPVDLDSTGSVNLTAYNFSAAENLPDFVVTLNSPPSNLSSVTITASWQATNSSSCTEPGTSVSGSVSLTGPVTGAPINTNQTISATVLSNGEPVSDGAVTFTCLSGPCTTSTGSGTTNASGITTFTYSSTVAGTDIWQASYTPSGEQTETSDAAVVWNFVAAAAPNQTSYGNTVTLSESGLPATATGTVTFTSGGTTLCTVTLTGLAGEATSCTTAVLPLGSYSVTAAYSGDANDPSSTASTSFAIGQASTSTSGAVKDVGTGATWTNTEVPGAVADDVASVTNGATGTVTYDLYSGDNCLGTLLGTSTEAVASGTANPSAHSTPLGAGSYSYQAVFNGTTDYSGSTGTCQPFSVQQAGTSQALAGLDVTTDSTWDNPEVLGTVASASAGLPSPSDTNESQPTPTGTVTYSFFDNGTCSGPAATTTPTTIEDGTVGTAPDTAALTPGSYSYEAVYSGDSNYVGSTSSCVLLTVVPATPTVGVSLIDAGTGETWTNTETTGASAYATSTVTGVEGFMPTSTLTYQFYATAECTGTLLMTSEVSLADGTPGSSEDTSALGAGSYFVQASYQGDANYESATSACVPFTVGQAAPTLSSEVDFVSGPQDTGSQAYDTAMVSGVDGFVNTGTVTYYFYSNATCTGDVDGQTVDLADGSVPNSATTSPLAAGNYSYLATYSGDANYLPATGSCQAFSFGLGTPDVTQQVDDSTTQGAWSGDETLGASAFDTTTVSGVESFTPTGTVTYELFDNGTCSGDPAVADTVDLGDGGSAPASPATGTLAAGTYGYEAVYNGDSNYGALASGCESFSVLPATPLATQSVDDAGTQGSWSGDETLGASAFDTSAVSGVESFTPTGTVTYELFDNGTCSGDPAVADTVELGDGGTVPNSSATGELHAGTYGYEAVYNGDSNYGSGASGCESFSVLPATPLAAQSVHDAATHSVWSGHETLGASAVDTATVTGISGFTPTGDVTYELFDNGTCSGTAAATATAPLEVSGGVPNSPSTGKLRAGTYATEAVYGGDGNYEPAASGCESFSVLPGASSASQSVHDAATAAVWSGHEVQGASSYDTAKVSGIAGFTPTGTVTYTLYNGSACTGKALSTRSVKLSGGSVPSSPKSGELAPGWFSYRVGYAGSGQYRASTSPCAVFFVKALGYRLEGGDGGVFDFRSHFRGSVPRLGLHIYDFVGMAAMTNGYWLVESDGGIYAFGTAHNYGTLPGRGIHVDDIIGIAATADGKGYWEVASNGAIYPFGDAVSHGDLPSRGVHVDDIVAIDSPDSGGYWLVGSDGHVYSFGNAKARGSCTSGSSCQGIKDIIGIASPDAGGYLLVSSNGRVFPFGDAKFHGSCMSSGSGCQGVKDVVGIATPGSDEGGYWLAGANGTLYAFGDAQNFGNETQAETHVKLTRPIVSITG